MACCPLVCAPPQKYSVLLQMPSNGVSQKKGLKIYFITFIIGPPDSEQCDLDLYCLKQVCMDLGVPLAPEKQAGPTSIIEFLGIIIDTVKQELRLPRDKLDRLLASIYQLEHKRSCLRKDLESLVRVLEHACTVIQGGKAFLRNPIIKLHSVKEQHHHVKFNVPLRSDLAWWSRIKI